MRLPVAVRVKPEVTLGISSFKKLALLVGRGWGGPQASSSRVALFQALVSPDSSVGWDAGALGHSDPSAALLWFH